MTAILVVLVAAVVYLLGQILKELRSIGRTQREVADRSNAVNGTFANLLELIQNDLKRVAGYVRYLRARQWHTDPTFIEDVNEGTSKFAPSWHDLKTEYGLWTREEDLDEGGLRVLRGE